MKKAPTFRVDADNGRDISLETSRFLFRRFSVSVDDCFLERCARSCCDGVENIRVQCLAILVECFLRHEDVQPLLGFCQPNAVYLATKISRSVNLATKISRSVNLDKAFFNAS